MQLKKILVAIDGSENSFHVLDFTLDLAEKFSSSVTILNVAEVLPLSVVPQESANYSVSSTAAFAKDIRKIHEDILSKAVSHAKTAKPDVAVSSELREGDAASEIVNVAKDDKFDIIVIGHKASSRVSERFLGSVSEKVAHLSPFPVIIVK